VDTAFKSFSFFTYSSSFRYGEENGRLTSSLYRDRETRLDPQFLD